MISFQNVSRTYNLDEESKITPVKNINLTVNRGEFILLIGRSGSGKTSLLNLAAGLVKPSSGTILIKNNDIWRLTDKQLSSLRAGTIGFVFQFPSLIPSLNVLENISLPVAFNFRMKKGSVYRRASDLLRKVGLGERMGVYPKQLSAGEQKRAVLARALMNDPEILLADEPTSDLDERTEQEIMSILRELHSGGMTILMVTHSTGLIPHASRTLKLEGGNLVGFTSA
ncbi:MAG TPA: ABC transporter ATP-binding protein [Dehalococcoidales bacterium]|nr:ABC transporter ATP-binding protein [Dehalococcoidales bacterium]